jgi:catechol 2,3-dioxygenase-like lactoylglutathione lyase family enzyme
MADTDPGEQLVVEVFVRDIGRSTAFYRSLGFELLRDAGTFVELTWEGSKLFLDERADLPVSTQPQANVRIMVADADSWWERAQRLGARIFQPIADRPYGLRDFTILDPDGFGLRFATRLEGERAERQEARRSIEQRLQRLGEAFDTLSVPGGTEPGAGQPPRPSR